MDSYYHFCCFLLLSLVCMSMAANNSDSGLCKMMSCGKGKCTHNTNSSTGLFMDVVPECVCDAGWSKIINLSILPCVIPNCSINYSCSNITDPIVSAAPPPSPGGITINPCGIGKGLCGQGDCKTTSRFGYNCVCHDGYENLANASAGPCVKSCAIGANCSSLGISMGPTSSPSSSSSSSSSASKASSSLKSCSFTNIVIMLFISVALLCFQDDAKAYLLF